MVEESCVFVNSGTALLISWGRVRVLEFNCFFESQVSVLQLKVSLSLFIIQQILSRKQVISVALYLWHSWKIRSGTCERFCCFRYFRSSLGISS